MKYYKLKEVFQNVNSEYDISPEIQRKLINGNAQYIIDLASTIQLYQPKIIKRNSYSTVSLAIQLCHYFFQNKCYLQYDRFIVGTACLLLALKIKDGDPRIRKLSQGYYTVMQSIEPQKMANEQIMQQIQNKVFIAESRILKVIEYDFDIKIPFDYVEIICKKFVPKGLEEDLYHTVKILMLDSYRTYASLVFNPYVILVGTFLVACSQLCYTPYTKPPPALNLPQTSNDEEAYINWLQLVEKELKEFDTIRSVKFFQVDKELLRQEDVKDFLLVFNELLFLNLAEKEDEIQQKKDANGSEQQYK